MLLLRPAEDCLSIKPHVCCIACEHQRNTCRKELSATPAAAAAAADMPCCGSSHLHWVELGHEMQRRWDGTCMIDKGQCTHNVIQISITISADHMQGVL
jgi:hypothetical protein